MCQGRLQTHMDGNTHTFDTNGDIGVDTTFMDTLDLYSDIHIQLIC